MRTDTTRVTTAGRTGKWTEWMQKRGDKRENVQIGKGDKKEGEREQRGHEWYAGGERSSPLIRLTKQKTQEGNTNTLHS